MNKYFSILVLCCSLFVISCNEHKVGYEDSLSCPSENLYAEILNDSSILASPKQLFLWDSLLVVADKRCGDNLFYLFSTSDGSLLKGGGKKGEGPGEVLSPDKAHLSSDGILSYWDINKSRIIRYDIDKLLSGIEQYFSEYFLDQQQASAAFLDVIALQQKYLYNGNTEKHIGIYPSAFYADSPSLPDIPSAEISRAIMNKAHWEVAPNEERVVCATTIGGIVQCYTIGDDGIKECWSKKFFPPVYKIVEGAKPAWITWCEDSQMGFDNLYVTKQHIYLLLNGKFAKDKPFANEILVMDWDGNIIKKFVLDKYVKTMAIDEVNRNIYAITCGFDVEADIVVFTF